jgi:hypothetical protein
MKLNDIALKYGTDKSNKAHNYVEKYEHYFESMRDKEIKLFEIGIQNGFSLKTWEEYFPNGMIYGIDIKDCTHMSTDRIKAMVCSQNNPAGLNNINEQHGPFDIIIDDGSHFSSDMNFSFNHLFPLLKEGGLYIIEDIHCCYWSNFSKGDKSFMNRMKEVLDLINSNGKCGLAEMKNIKEDHVYQERKFGEMNWWEANIEYLHMYKSIVFIKKRENESI